MKNYDEMFEINPLTKIYENEEDTIYKQFDKLMDEYKFDIYFKE